MPAPIPVLTVEQPEKATKGDLTMTKLVSTLMVLLTLFYTDPAAYAAGNAQTHQSAQGQNSYLRSKVEYESEHLTKMIDLPEVPYFTGQAVFVSGTRFPNAKGGSSTTILLHSLEYPSQVRAWYAAALEQCRWRIEKQMTNDNAVSAWRGKRLFQVIVRRPSNPRYRSDILIRYKDEG